jgi:hypothetical protein
MCRFSVSIFTGDIEVFAILRDPSRLILSEVLLNKLNCTYPIILQYIQTFSLRVLHILGAILCSGLLEFLQLLPCCFTACNFPVDGEIAHLLLLLLVVVVIRAWGQGYSCTAAITLIVHLVF